MSVYIPDRGHIVDVNFDPSAGTEIMKRRPALVLSRKLFNQHTGFAWVAPITSTVRGMAMEVELTETTTQGVVLPHQLKSFDYFTRQIHFVESAPAAITATVVKYAKLILD